MELRPRFGIRTVLVLTTAVQLLAAAFGVSILLRASVAQASPLVSVPYLINFQGRLTDNSGNVLSDGSYNVKFRIFDAASGPTNRWEGDRVYGASDHRITVENGLFNIQFGDTSKGDPALSPSLFNTQTYANLYLEVEMPTPATATCASNGCASFTEGPMTPRQPLATAPYAFNADNLDGLDSTDFAQLSGTQQTGALNVTGNITSAAVLQGASETLTGTSSLTLGTAGPSGNTGAVIFKDAANANTVTLQAGTTSGNYTLTLPTGQASGTQFLQNNGSGGLSWASPGTCTSCVLFDSNITNTTNTIAPTTDTTSLTIRQTSFGSPTKNIFDVTDSGGTTHYLKIDQSAAITVGAATTLSLSSGGSSDLSLSSGSGTINLTASTLKRTAAGITTFDLTNTADTTLAVTNSDGSHVANLTVEGGVSIGSGQTYKINGTPITSAALSNDSDLAKLTANSAQSFTGQNTFSRNGTGTGDYSLGVTGTPVADATSELLRLGGANIASGSSSGTYIGVNPTSFSGDFANFQVNGAVRLKVASLGDITTSATQLDGTGNASPTGNASTSMTLSGASPTTTLFDVGNYIKFTSTSCGGAGVNTCYAKITQKTTTVLTITPALSWANNTTVNEYHLPEIGGVDTSQSVDNRYGRGYFIAGVATGNGTTYYNEDSIDTTHTSFDLLTNNVTTLNIGSSSTTVSLPGSLSVGGQSIVNGSGQINGSQVPYGSTTNTAVQGNTTLVCPTGTGNISSSTGGNTITLGSGGTCTALNTVNNPSFSTSVTSPSFTGVAAVTVSSGGSSDLTLDSASNTIQIAATDTILQRTASGTYTVNLSDSANTTLAVTNSGTGVANLTTDGSITGVGVNAGSGTLQGTGGATLSGTTSINDNTNSTTKIGTGSSNALVSIGGGSGTFALDTTNIDISSAGAITGTTGVALASGNFSQTGSGTFATGTGAVSLNGATTAKTTSTNAFQVQDASANQLFNLDTATMSLTVNTDSLTVVNLSAPTSPAVVAGANTGGTLSGAAGTTYFYKVSALNSLGETLASSEVSINGQSFTQLTAPGALTAAQGAVGGSMNPSVNYTYKVTFVSANGETTGGTTSAICTTTANKLQCNLSAVPLGPTGTTARKIYRTTGGGSSYFLVNTGTTYNDNLTQASTDGTSDASLGAAIPVANTATTNTNNATVSWSSVPGSTSYRIYRGTTTATEDHYQTATTSPFTDTGATGTAASPSGTSSAGQVGIGTATPTANLDVEGTGLFKNGTDSLAAFQIQNAAATVLLVADTTDSKLVVGAATTDATQILLQLDSYAAVSGNITDTASCTTTANQGALYYNTNSNAIRGCVNGAWEDVVTTAGLGIVTFGIVPDSGGAAGAAPGDYTGITAAGAGPCKVTRGNGANTVRWNGCVAYSSGRKIVVPDQTADFSTGITTTASQFQNICLATTNTDQPTFVGSGSTTDGSQTEPSFNPGSPVVCLATIKESASPPAIAQIYDTRVFTTTTKQFVNLITTPSSPGMLVRPPASGSLNAGQYVVTNAAAGGRIAGVVVATSGTTNANTINAIIATAGPAFVKASGGTIGDYLQTVASAGLTATVSAISTNAYANAGVALSSFSATTCTGPGTDVCRGSVFTLLDIK